MMETKSPNGATTWYIQMLTMWPLTYNKAIKNLPIFRVSWQRNNVLFLCKRLTLAHFCPLIISVRRKLNLFSAPKLLSSNYKPTILALVSTLVDS